MNLIFAYTIPIMLFFVGLKAHKSKFVTILFLIYFWIIMGLNTNTPDYSSYERYYLYTYQFYVEWGFALLCNICRKLGLTYMQFRMVFAAIYSILTIATAKRLTSHVNYVLAMFLLLPFVLNVSGIRYALASMIVCYGIPYLIPDHKHGTLKYILCIILASSIHLSSVFFLVYLFVRKKYMLLQYCLIIFVVFFGGFLIKTSFLYKFALTYFPHPRLLKWLSLTNTEIGRLNTTGFILNVFFVIAFPLLISILTKFIVKSSNISGLSNKQLQKLNLYKNISICGLLAIPGYFISSEYQRLLFGMLIVYYSTFAEFKYTRVNIDRFDKFIYKVICFALVFLLLALYMYSMKSHDVLATFRDNILFQ